MPRYWEGGPIARRWPGIPYGPEEVEEFRPPPEEIAPPPRRPALSPTAAQMMLPPPRAALAPANFEPPAGMRGEYLGPTNWTIAADREEQQRQLQLRAILAQIEGQESETATRRRALEPVELPGGEKLEPRALPFAQAEQAARLKALEPYTLGEGQERLVGGQVIAKGQPKELVPGRDVPYSPEVETQRRTERAQEPGSYIPLTDEQGRVVGAWNPKSKQVEQIPEQFQGARKTGLSTTELTARGQLGLMSDELKTLRTLAQAHPEAIGFLQGRLAAAQRLTIGADPEVNELFRISDNLADVLLRARSGAQINEQEYSRLRTLVPNPRFAQSKFFSDLDSFEKELNATIERRMGSPAQGNAPVSRGPAVAPEGSIVRMRDGTRRVKKGGQWVPVP